MIWYMIYDIWYIDILICDIWYIDVIYWYVIYDMWYMICDIWYDMICDICDMIYDMIWYMIWYDMIWYDMIWYDMIWYDMIWYDILNGAYINIWSVFNIRNVCGKVRNVKENAWILYSANREVFQIQRKLMGCKKIPDQLNARRNHEKRQPEVIRKCG